MSIYLKTPEFTRSQLLDEIRTLFPNMPALSIFDLRNPSSSFVQHLYISCLMALGADCNGIQSETSCDMLNHMRPLLYLRNAMNLFFKPLGINDFSVSDLLNPDPDRNFVQMSVVIHFLIYFREVAKSIEPELEEIQNLLAQRESVLKTINSNLEKIEGKKLDEERLNRKLTQEKELADEEDNAIKQLELKADETKKIVMELSKTDLSSKKLELTNTIYELEEEIRQLEKQVNKNPEEMKLLLEELIQNKNELIRTCQELAMRGEELRSLWEILHPAEEELKKVSSKLNRILSQYRDMNEFVTLQIIAQNNVDLKNLQKEVTDFKEKLDIVTGKFSELYSSYSKEFDEIQRMEKDYLMNYEKFTKEIDIRLELSDQKLKLISKDLKKQVTKYEKIS